MSRAVLNGIAVSAGIAVGKAFFLDRNRNAEIPQRKIREDAVPAELARLSQALDAVRAEIEKAATNIPAGLQDQAAILAAHLMICKDPKLILTTQRHIRSRHNAEWALAEAVADIAVSFNMIDDAYIRERLQDVRAVAKRIISRLLGRGTLCLPAGEPIVLLAHDLTPTDALELSPSRILCFATEEGGRTAHTGILARSLRIPAVVGVNGLERTVNDGETIILDALKGLVFVNPDQNAVKNYTELQQHFIQFQENVRKQAALPAETRTGFRVLVRGNTETLPETTAALESGGEGIGLYRTEYAYISRANAPTEQELLDEYSRVLTTVAPHQVTFRTLDVGADKMLWAQKNQEEANPALGLRAIRYCLRNQDMFRRQLRALLRASVSGKAAVMFPMISGLKELRQAKAVLNEVKQELDASKLPYDRNIPLGIMIELPSAVLTADALAHEVDFFSIGTNDLIQYSLGIDRGNKHVSYLYQPLHPGIVRAVKYVVDMGHREGISVSLCGEMASDPYCIPILLGMGIDEFSMAPQAIPGIKHIIRGIDIDECRELLRQVYSAGTVETVNRIVKQALFQRFPAELPFYVSVLDSEE